jgi:hypothetical protein
MINTGFETPLSALVGGACFFILGDPVLPGWSSTDPAAGAETSNCTFPPGTAGQAGGKMEVWLNSFNGVTARAGRAHAELNANTPAATRRAPS